jgi:uncharacterized protein involved in type VI secretion and phage assembly
MRAILHLTRERVARYSIRREINAMLEAFRQWFQIHQSLLTQKGVDVRVSPGTQGLDKNSIHAELRTPRYEWLVQLWETGESDFHFLDWDAADDGVIWTHYEFPSKEELYAALDGIIEKLS